MLATVGCAVAVVIGAVFFGWSVHHAWRNGLQVAEDRYQEYLALKWGDRTGLVLHRRETVLAEFFRQSFSSRVYQSQFKGLWN